MFSVVKSRNNPQALKRADHNLLSGSQFPNKVSSSAMSPSSLRGYFKTIKDIPVLDGVVANRIVEARDRLRLKYEQNLLMDAVVINAALSKIDLVLSGDLGVKSIFRGVPYKDPEAGDRIIKLAERASIVANRLLIQNHAELDSLNRTWDDSERNEIVQKMKANIGQAAKIIANLKLQPSFLREVVKLGAQLGYEGIHRHHLSKDALSECSEKADLNKSRYLKIVQTLIYHNLKLAVYVVKHNSKAHNYSLAELISEGNDALSKAAVSFNLNRGANFATYAGRCVANHMKALITRSTVNGVGSAALASKVVTVKQAYEKLFKILGKKPSHEELADEIGCSYESISKVRPIKFYSFDALKYGTNSWDHSADFDDSIEDLPLHTRRGKQISLALQDLSVQERVVVKLKFGFIRNAQIKADEIDYIIKRGADPDSLENVPRNYVDIGRILNYTKQRIEQIYSDARKKLGILPDTTRIPTKI